MQKMEDKLSSMPSTSTSPLPTQQSDELISQLTKMNDNIRALTESMGKLSNEVAELRARGVTKDNLKDFGKKVMIMSSFELDDLLGHTGPSVDPVRGGLDNELSTDDYITTQEAIFGSERSMDDIPEEIRVDMATRAYILSFTEQQEHTTLSSKSSPLPPPPSGPDNGKLHDS